MIKLQFEDNEIREFKSIQQLANWLYDNYPEYFDIPIDTEDLEKLTFIARGYE